MQLLTRRCFLWLLLLWPLWMAGWPPTLRAEDLAQEYQLKAAFLINFAKFITWPEQALPTGQQEFILCVVGDDPFGPALAGSERKTVGGRAIREVRTSSLKKIPDCQMLFISRSEADDLNLLAATLGRKAVVTVSDIPNFGKAGHIQLFVSGNRLSFVINHTAMKELGFQVNASLLSLAADVY